MGTEPVGRLFAGMAMPAVIAMLVNGLYYMVDAVYLGRGVGPDALAGLAVTFPVEMLVVAVGAMIGLGTASIVSRRLGEGNGEGARAAAGNAIFISLFVGGILLVVFAALLPAIVQLLGGTPVSSGYALGYLRVLLFGFPLVFLSFAGANLVRAEGNALLSMIGMIAGSVVDMALGAIFIFRLGMAVEGAAASTVIARALTTALYAAYLLRGKTTLRLRLRHLRPRLDILRQIVQLGAGSFLSQFCLCLVAVVMNLSLRHYGTDATRSIYGVLGRMLVFVTMPLLGLGQGLQPIVGFNYGAKRLDRVARAFVIATAASLALGGALCALLDAVPGAILRLFTTNSEVIAQGIRPLRITTMLLPLVGIQVMAFSYFQALGKSLAALVSSLSRQFLFLVPLLLLLPPFLGASGVWIAYPIADGAAVLLCVIWVRAEQRRLGTEAAGSLAAEEARAR